MPVEALRWTAFGGGPLTTSSHDLPATATAEGSGTPAAPRLGVAVALLTVYLVWGSTYLAIRVVVTSGLPPLLGMGGRFLLAGVLLGGVLGVRRGARALRVTRSQLVTAAVVGVLLLCGGNGLVAVAEQTLPSGLAALLVSTTPLWLVVLGLLTGDRARRASIVGTLVGFAGTAVLARPSGQGAVAWWAAALILLATLCWASGSLYSRRRPHPADAFVGSAYQMVLGGAALTFGGLVRGEAAHLDLAAVPARGWVALAYLVVVGSLVAYTAYFWLLGNAPLQLVSTYAYVNPVVAVLLGWALLGEQISVPVVVGGALAVAGVVLVISSERSASHEDPDELRPVDPARQPGT
jgi:drug/metabolite transporter (DMT)-like permease